MISQSQNDPIDLDLVEQVIALVPEETWSVVIDAVVANLVDAMSSAVLERLTGSLDDVESAEEILLDYYRAEDRQEELIIDAFKIIGTENTLYLLDSLQLGKCVESLVESNPAICSGQLVFKGTRIPVAVVVGQLRAGVLLTELQEDFPQLSRAALDYAEAQARTPKAFESIDTVPCSVNVQ